MGTNTKANVNTVEVSFAVLEHLMDVDGASLHELTQDFNQSRSTIHRHLSTLHNLGYIIKEGGSYYPSLRFLNYSQYVRYRKKGYDFVESKVEELATVTKERVQFFVEEFGKGVYLYRATGENAVLTKRGIGKEIHLHRTAGGKTILAQYSDDRVKEIIDEHGLPGFTENTITDEEELFENLETIRERGYGQNIEESLDGLKAVAVPVKGADRKVLGAISVSGPTNRMKGEWFEQELPDLLLGTANEIELNILNS